MWQYSGPGDASQMGRTDLEEKTLEAVIHGVIKGAKTDELPKDCPLDPYSSSRALPEV